jgi:hypothetical protein
MNRYAYFGSVWTIIFGAIAMEGGDVGCTKQEVSGIAQILTQVGTCVEPIVVQGLLAGQPAGTIATSALSCAGATLDGILAYVESLMSGGDAGAALSADAAERLGALHAELLNRKANGSLQEKIQH